MAVLVDLQQVSARRGERVLFDDLSLTVNDGDRVGVVGINGTGKSTLLEIVAGVETPDTGLTRRGHGVRVGYLAQEPFLPAGDVRSAVGPGWQADAALERLGMGGAGSTDVAALSGGQAKRVALAALLARPAEVLVIDEPTNHLDLPAVAWLERWLLQYRGGLVLVTHDRHLLDKVTTKMLELDRGHAHVHEGGYAAYLSRRAQREDRAAAAESTRQNLARRELAWLRRGAPARTRKPQARIDAAVQLLSARAEPPARSGELRLSSGMPRLGDKVIACEGVGYHYGPTTDPVLKDVDLLLGPRERLGVIGPNGSGKSTLLDVLAQRRQPTAGRLEVGPTVVIGYYDQHGIEVDAKARVRDLVAGPTRVPGTPEDVALMNRFWFSGALQFTEAGALSGGERRRLQLLLLLAERPNVLLLDEPTNDLDIDTLRILEDYFEDWPGALVVVSHDRTFLERTTDRLVTVERASVSTLAGGIDAWTERQRDDPGELAPPSSSSPTSRRTSHEVASDRPRRGRSPSTIGREMREVEKEVARLGSERDGLGDALSKTSDHIELARVGRQLADVQARLAAAETRWFSLAEEAEAGR